MFTLMQTCKLKDVDPQAWLVDVAGLTSPIHKVTDLWPRCCRGNWRLAAYRTAAA